MNWLADSKPSFPGDFSEIVYAQIYARFFLRHLLASSLDFRLRFSDPSLHDRRILELRQRDLLDSLTHRPLRPVTPSGVGYSQFSTHLA